MHRRRRTVFVGTTLYWRNVDSVSVGYSDQSGGWFWKQMLMWLFFIYLFFLSALCATGQILFTSVELRWRQKTRMGISNLGELKQKLSGWHTQHKNSGRKCFFLWFGQSNALNVCMCRFLIRFLLFPGCVECDATAQCKRGRTDVWKPCFRLWATAGRTAAAKGHGGDETHILKVRIDFSDSCLFNVHENIKKMLCIGWSSRWIIT